MDFDLIFVCLHDCLVFVILNYSLQLSVKFEIEVLHIIDRNFNKMFSFERNSYIFEIANKTVPALCRNTTKGMLNNAIILQCFQCTVLYLIVQSHGKY